MHSSAILNLERFFKIYLKKFNNPTILDYGGASQGKQTTALNILKRYYTNYKYLSLDVAPNKNVDIVLKDPYKINELEKESIDIIICTSVFEHIEFFWLTYLEILKLLKPKGIFYLNAENMNDHKVYNTLTLSIHEASPGHHYQHAYPMMYKIPLYKNYIGNNNCYTEGWALYTETLYDYQQKDDGHKILGSSVYYPFKI